MLLGFFIKRLEIEFRRSNFPLHTIFYIAVAPVSECCLSEDGIGIGNSSKSGRGLPWERRVRHLEDPVLRHKEAVCSFALRA